MKIYLNYFFLLYFILLVLEFTLEGLLQVDFEPPQKATISLTLAA